MKPLSCALLFFFSLASQGCQCQLSNTWTGDAPPAMATMAPENLPTRSLASVAPEAIPSITMAGAMGAPPPAEGVRLDPVVAHPVLPAGERQTTYVRINLTAFEMEGDERIPANVAIVLDRSSSMTGDKFRQAQKAAVEAVYRLLPDDVVSVVAYDTFPDVLVPATSAADPAPIIDAIERCRVGGSTALYAGVGLGEYEVRKNLGRDRVNRIVLLSDGMANVGPSSPDALAEVGAKLREDDIGVTTIGLGLGYDERLMSRLALASGGNHFFAENGTDLKKGFDLEFGIGLAAVVKGLRIRVDFLGGALPRRVLNAGAELHGHTVTARIPQLYSGRHAGLLIEVDVPPGKAGVRTDLASVSLSYTNMKTRRAEERTGHVAVTFSDSAAEVEASVETDVMVRAATLLADRRTEAAYNLRKQGKVEEARRAFEDSAKVLEVQGQRYGSSFLQNLAQRARSRKSRLSGAEYEYDVKDYQHRGMSNFAEYNAY